MNLPSYPSYRDSGISWLGAVPTSWPTQRFDANTRTHRESITPERLEGKDVLHYSIPSIQDTGRASVEEGSTIDSSKLVVNTLQLLVSKLNPHKQVVLLAEPHAELLTVASTEFVPLLPTGSNAKYIQYVWQSARCLHYLLARCDSATRSHQRVTPDDISKMPWAWPDALEQQTIAAFLERETAKIDKLVAEQEKLIALLAEKRQGTVSRAVTSGLDPNAPLKDSGVAWLGAVPAHWRVLPLKQFGRIGNGSTPNRENPEYWAEQGFPWLNSSVVNQDIVSEAEQFVTDKALAECHLPIVRPPAVLVGITGQGKTRGMATRLCLTATVNQHLAYIRPDERELKVHYLVRFLEAAYEHLRVDSDGAGSTKGAITCDQLGRLRIATPDIKEQGEIIDFLSRETSKLDGLVSVAESAIELLKERRTALIAAAVTGQIDVRKVVRRDVMREELAA